MFIFGMQNKVRLPGMMVLVFFFSKPAFANKLCENTEKTLFSLAALILWNYMNYFCSEEVNVLHKCKAYLRPCNKINQYRMTVSQHVLQ